MSQILEASMLWLHSMANIILIGHYLLLSLLYLPVMTQNGLGSIEGLLLCKISKRSRPWMYLSLLTLAVTGVYLTFADPDYQGIGNFSNPWAILMLVKHLVILAMLGIGFWFNAILRVGPQIGTNHGATQALKQFRLYAGLMAISGSLVLLLTAIAQAA
jgi:uncharacterized membrane protein